MKKIVFCDIDGTLLNSEHKITERTEKAIKELRKKDIPFILISGRSPECIYPILKEYDFNCPIIGFSGGLILDENRNVLFNKGIEKQVAKKMIEFIEDNHFDLSWCIYSSDKWIVKDKNDPRIIEEEEIVKVPAVQESIDSINAKEINKILCICSPSEVQKIEAKLKEAFPSYSIVKSCDFQIEIMAKGITKAHAIHTLCSLWNIDIKDTIAFGDNYNDLEMLEAVGSPFLMGNAPNDLKRRIKIHTLDNDHDGIYYGLLEMKLI